MSGQGVRWLISLTWLISPRGRGRPKAEEAVDATIPVADNVASNLTDCEIRAASIAVRSARKQIEQVGVAMNDTLSHRRQHC